MKKLLKQIKDIEGAVLLRKNKLIISKLKLNMGYKNIRSLNI